MLFWLFLVCVIGTNRATECPTLPSSHPCTCSVLDGTDIQPLEVDCEDKDLSSIPDLKAFRGKPIHYLSLAQNDISSIPDGALDGLLFQSASFLRSDSFIDLSENPIGDISPDAFAGIKSENVGLRLGKCGFSKIPHAALQKMSNWTFLFFDDNQIKNLPANEFKNLRNLRHLDLSDNPITQINENAFMDLEDVLENLNLKKTSLTSVPTAAIEKLRKLEQLSLDGTKIQNLPADVFGSLATSTGLTLHMRRTGLKTISKDVFKNAKFTVKSMRIDENELSDLSFLSNFCHKVFERKPSFSVLSDPINCDCHLYTAVKSRRFTLQGKCETPDPIKGTDIARDFLEEGKGMCHGKVGDTSCKYGAHDSHATMQYISLSVFFLATLLHVLL